MRQTKGWGANLASQCNYIWPSHRAPQQERKKRKYIYIRQYITKNKPCSVKVASLPLLS